ncbi:MAG: beta-ketoacyl synthase N-terminal-like domain-containing protein [Pirellulaceae bacterium]
MEPTHVVITGFGQISPLGNTRESLTSALEQGATGIDKLRELPHQSFPSAYAGEARDFTGEIGDFGDVDKAQIRAIKKNLKVMCREIQMGVAAAQHAVQHAQLSAGTFDPERAGVVYGSDYMMTLPQEFGPAVEACRNDEGKFDAALWAEKGLAGINPLWLLKYLPNMPASHIAIFNDMRGPNNSLTLREASSNIALGEALTTITRGHADIIVAGATGTRVHEMRTMHIVLQEPESLQSGVDADGRHRSFDKNRNGMVLGEGAGALILETKAHAKARGATIYGEMLSQGASMVSGGSNRADRRRALANALKLALTEAGVTPGEIGHINAHGLATRDSDQEEAAAILDAMGDAGKKVPVVAAKSYFGNLGAAGGTVELICSLIALGKGTLFPTLNYETPDPDCPLNVVSEPLEVARDGLFVNLSFTPQGQASAVVIRGAA